MTHTNYGGFVEYAAAVLLAIQIVLARSYLARRPANWPRAARIAAVTALVLLWSATLAALFLELSGIMYTSRIIPVGLGTAVTAIGYFWILLSSLSYTLIGAVRLLFKRIPGGHSPARRNWLRAAGVAAVGAPAAATAFGALVERNRYGIAELDLPVPGLHPDLEGFRIVQVSDLHVSPFLSPRQAGRVIDMANELHADLAVFTGDLITELGDPLDDAIRELIRLRADHGVLGCMGNHEQYVSCRNYLQRQAGMAGLVFLRGAATQIHRGQAVLNVAGVGYQRGTDPAHYLVGAESLIVPGASNLLLSHNPDVFPTAIRRGFQAVLSGHTHGGQINVEILDRNINPARFRTPFTSGLYRLGLAQNPRATDTGGLRALADPRATDTSGLRALADPRATDTSGLRALADPRATDTSGLRALVDPRAPDTGGLRALADPRATDTGGLRALADPRATDTGGLRALADPRATDTGGLRALNDPRATDTGGLRALADPRATDTGGLRAGRQTLSSCFVTNGIGTIGLPIRLGAPPEIALLRLRRA